VTHLIEVASEGT